MGSEIQIALRLSDNNVVISYIPPFKFAQLQLKTNQNVFVFVHKSRIFSGEVEQTLTLARSGRL
jgi:hypothetical protein